MNSQKHLLSKQIYITSHPYYPFFLSAGEDGNMVLWDNEKNQIFKNFKVEKNVSAVKISPKGNFLVVGLEDGGVMLAEIKIEKVLYANKNNESKLYSIYLKKEKKKEGINNYMVNYFFPKFIFIFLKIFQIF